MIRDDKVFKYLQHQADLGEEQNYYIERYDNIELSMQHRRRSPQSESSYPGYYENREISLNSRIEADKSYSGPSLSPRIKSQASIGR